MPPDKLTHDFTGLLSMLFNTYGGELQPHVTSSWTQVILCKRLTRSHSGKLNEGLLRPKSRQKSATSASRVP